MAVADPSPARGPRTLRGAGLSLILLAAATSVCALIGLALTERHDARLRAERHAALQATLDDDAAFFGPAAYGNAQVLDLIAQRSRLADLRFGTNPMTAQGREIQSVHDAQGRIIGWFSWAPERGMLLVMKWLWGMVGAAGIALALGATILARKSRGLRRALTRSTESMRKLESQDPLTGLANQRTMLERLDAALARRDSGIVLFALIDMDGFREINDTLGRAGGDAAFRQIAQGLTTRLPAGALLGRFGDDEFAVIAADTDADAASLLAQTLRAAIAEPFILDATLRMTAAMGLAQAPQDGVTAEELERRASLALRAAKREGRGAARRFELPIEIEHAERRFLLRELELAVANEAFALHYQPVVAAAGGAMVGVEALLRWTHPSRGAIAPSIFIPLAEASGLMRKLGEFALRRALADAARWPDLAIAVNLSPVQIRDPNLVDLVGAALADIGIAPTRVVLEVTEGILIDDPQQTLERLEALRGLSVTLALDDFGTGYSSLSYLQKFPFQQVKIDRAFVASLGTVGNVGAIVQSIVTLGHALGMKVVAEGVETDEQRVLLRLAGCDEMQGFLFAKPQPAAAIDKLVARSASRRQAAES